MNHSDITNDTELHHRIMKLNYLKEEQELVIKRNVKELAYSMQPSMILKNMVHNLSTNKAGEDSLKSVGLNLGLDFLVMKLFGRSGLKGFLSSIVIKKASEYVINNHPDLISKGISKLMSFLGGMKAKAEKEAA